MVEALGVTDYFSIQTYRRAKEHKAAGRIPAVKLMFPNVEMRLDIKTTKSKGINLHLLFSPEDPNHEQEIERLLSLLEFEFDERPYRCTISDLTHLGYAVEPGLTTDSAALYAGHKSVQDNLRIVRSEPARYTLAPPESSIRSIYFERMLPSPTTNAAVEFTVDYEYRAHGVWFDLTPEKSQPLSPGETELAQFLKEAPHVEFSPAMRRLSQQLEGSETNPVRRAKRFYDWIAGHIRYSFAPEYSTIRNLSEFCLSRGYGDCGMEALLFMTLCRMNGIPARWQSGWSIFPGAETIHDWCEIYLAPWGWVPVDPYMGIYASQYTPTLTAQQRQELSDFYFGGLTQFRMTANSDHNQALVPAKGSFRSDDVDFQRGEVDIGGRNVYFNQQTFDFKFWILDFALDCDLDYLLD